MKPKFLKSGWLLTAIFILFIPSLTFSADLPSQTAYTDALAKLNAQSMQERAAAIEQLAAVKNPEAIVILKALLEGQLLNLKAENKLVIGEEIDTGYKIHDAKSGQDLGTVERDATQKINLNNSLRVSLRKTLGQLELNSDNVKPESARYKRLRKILMLTV